MDNATKTTTLFLSISIFFRTVNISRPLREWKIHNNKNCNEVKEMNYLSLFFHALTTIRRKNNLMNTTCTTGQLEIIYGVSFGILIILFIILLIFCVILIGISILLCQKILKLRDKLEKVKINVNQVNTDTSKIVKGQDNNNNLIVEIKETKSIETLQRMPEQPINYVNSTFDINPNSIVNVNNISYPI